MKPQILSLALALTCTTLLLNACGPASGPAPAGTTETGQPQEHGTDEPLRGPHRGRLLQSGELTLEVSIFEAGVAPEFRIYPMLKGKPLPPQQVALTLTLKRLGGSELIRFRPRADYLLGNAVVREPHSFAVTLQATVAGRQHTLRYEQIEGRLRLSDEQVQASGIDILTAGPALVSDSVELPGEIRVAANSETVVLAPVSGVVVSAPVLLGQEVKRGAVLAVLESRELADLQRGYLEARERAQLAGASYRREAQLWQEGITPEQDYLAARSARAEADIAVASTRAGLLAYGVSPADLAALSLSRPGNLSRLTLRAPRDGRVTARDLAPGQRVTPDSRLLTIADVGQLMAVVSATSGQLDALQPGQPVSLTLSQGTLTGTGKVLAISPQLDEGSRAAPVHISLDGGQPGWRPGQFIKARISQAQTRAAVTVSAEALQHYRDWTVVFARYGDQFEVRPVTLGRQDGQRVEILSGLEAGQAYAGRNSFLLKADLGKSEAEHDH